MVDRRSSRLGPAAEYGVRLRAHWFDADAGGAFCFAKAPGPENLEALHRASHGLVPNRIIDVSEDSVLRFLGPINDPVDEARPTSPFRTILFTDREGLTSLLGELGEAAFMVLLTEHDEIIRRALVTSRGREVKHTVDGIMASFDDVSHALECVLATQDAFRARNRAGSAKAPSNSSECSEAVVHMLWEPFRPERRRRRSSCGSRA